MTRDDDEFHPLDLDRPDYDEGDLGPCPICGRPMISGASVDRHHWVPKTEGGQDWDWLHRICHKKIHSLFSERELAQVYHNPEDLLTQPEMIKFVKWVRKRPPEFIAPQR